MFSAFDTTAKPSAKEPLPSAQQQVPTADSPETRELSPRAFPYWPPIELPVSLFLPNTPP